MGDRWQTIGSKLARCKTELPKWQCKKYGTVTQLMVQLKKKLNKAMDNEDLRASDEVKTIQQELKFILEKEDTKWKQRAKANWLRNEDRNTKFYHA